VREKAELPRTIKGRRRRGMPGWAGTHVSGVLGYA